MTSSSTSAAQELLQLAAMVASDPERFTPYFDDPDGFVQDILGKVLWPKQLAVLEAARDFKRVAVRSGHGVGKTFACACLIVWWLYARKGRVVTTAPTWESVEGVLWQEIHSIIRGARVPLPGDFLKTEIQIDPSWNAVGLSTNMPSAFQGRHHPRLLVVIDEAPGVSEQVHLEIATLATGDENRIVMIGNPTVTSGTFYEAFKHPELWKGLRLSCYDHPNVIEGKELVVGAVTRGWIEERRQMWGENHPFWASRVLGDFPKISARGVIPLGWVERSQNATKHKQAIEEAEASNEPKIGGLDVARYGDNKCVLTVRQGDAVLSVESWHHTTLMETCGRALVAIRERGLKSLVIDAAGLGAGVYDRLNEQNAPVFAYNGGHRAFTPAQFANRRSEMWWHLRARLEKERLWLPERGIDQLVSELVTPEYTLTSAGRLQVETKERLTERGEKSPDFADSLVLCFALDEDPEIALVEPPRGPHRDPALMLDWIQKDTPYGNLPLGF